MRRTIVKVCGLTRAEDVRAAREAGADWIGFVLLGESPRRIDAAHAARLRAASSELTAVAVMVTPTPEQAIALARAAGCERVQLHRVEPATWPADFPLPVTFSIPVEADGRFGHALPDARHLVMLDGAHATRAGGTGVRVPWDVAMKLAAVRDIVLAGGLDAEAVAEAIERVRPYGVDASSRLESQPGIKDHARLRAFVRTVRETDERLAGQP